MAASTADTSPRVTPELYVAPPMRKRLQEQNQMMEMGLTPPPPPSQSGHHSRHHPARGRGISGYNGGRSHFNRNYSYNNSHHQHQNQHQSEQQAVPDRWKALVSDTNTSHHYNRDFRSKSSTTGTGWDIRDGRHWRPENANEVFKEEGAEKATGINFTSYNNIPVELSGGGSEDIKPMESFKEPVGGVHKLLLVNISRVDYETPTPVQRHSIPVILAGRDLMACAQTGSGKTAAFLFPIITHMLQTGPPSPCVIKNRYKPPAFPVALVLSPTRELAVQIYKESLKFAFGTGIKTSVVYGGSEAYSQLLSIKNGCDICVATPGRLSEFASRGYIALNSIKYFVLDEADRMLDMGFSPQIYAIVNDYSMPSSHEGRQTIMFSATFPNQIQKLAREFLNDYIFLTVGRVGSTNEFIQQNFIYAEESNKPRRLLNVLDENKSGLVLVFVETKKKADLIEKFLSESGLPAVSLHGDKCQEEREEALRLFRTGNRSVLVATDVAARGLDIHNIEHVINCDLPARIEDYVHRIGRTGRAGNGGKATSFVNEQNKAVLRDLMGLLEEAQQEIPPWFYQLAKSCASAHRGFGSGGTSMFGKYHNNKNSGNNMNRTGFGGRDVRGSDFSRPTNHNNNRIPMKGMTSINNSCIEQDDEDGWE